MTRPAVIPVRPGTAENLARLAHFRSFEDHPQVDELDQVAVFLIGHVGPQPGPFVLWEQLRGDLLHLWHLITDDFTEADCDELSDDEEDRERFSSWGAYMDRRREVTVTRLSFEIEQTILCERIHGAARTRAALAGVL